MMEEKTERNPLDDPKNPMMRPSVATAVREMKSRAPLMAANGIFQHPPECTQEEQNFIADCLKKNIPVYVIAGMIHAEKSFLYRYIKNHPELMALKEEQGDNILDEAEYQIERLNKELKRRSKVIGVFPNEDSVLRLMGSGLIERHDAIQAGRAVFSKESLASLMNSDVPAKLIVIAEEQRQLWAA